MNGAQSLGKMIWRNAALLIHAGLAVSARVLPRSVKWRQRFGRGQREDRDFSGGFFSNAPSAAAADRRLYSGRCL